MLHDAEVDQLDQRLVAMILGQHQIVRRDVAMNVALLVQVLDGLQRLPGDDQRQRDSRPALCFEHLSQIDAADELLNDEAVARSFVDLKVVELRDVRVAQLDRRSGLATKALLGGALLLVLGENHLDDANLVELTMADPVDRAHSTFVDLLENLVLALDDGEWKCQSL